MQMDNLKEMPRARRINRMRDEIMQSKEVENVFGGQVRKINKSRLVKTKYE